MAKGTKGVEGAGWPSRAFDWYRSDPTTGGVAPTGIARTLITSQQATGRWDSNNGYWTDSLSTSFSVIILSPTIFQLAPTAVCSALSARNCALRALCWLRPR